MTLRRRPGRSYPVSIQNERAHHTKRCRTAGPRPSLAAEE